MSPALVRRLDIGGLILMLLTLVVTVAWGFPLFWSIMVTVVPEQSGGSVLDFLGLYAHVLFQTSIGRWYLNSLITAGGTTLITLFISATCGYAISQLDFTGKRLLWWVILASFMIPIQALIVNHFFLMNQWKLINTWLGVILPQLIAPVAVIIYKQFFDTVPKELREAALIDGAKQWQILFSIYLPLNWGVTAALGIIVFIASWNAFLWPFLAVTKPEMMNVTVGATQARETFGVGDMAGALLTAMPIAIVYLLFQRKVTEAVMLSAGIKG